MIRDSSDLEQYLETYHAQHSEFHQAVLSWYSHIADTYLSDPEFCKNNILTRMIEADRVVRFVVPWRDDDGQVRVNHGWRVQHSNNIGPYKGGIRFDPTVTESVLKFLAFEQTSKNILTGLDLGGGKGGLDIEPRDLSIGEMERVITVYMAELYKYIGPDVDVPAGDIGVGTKEVAMLFNNYVRLTDRFEGALTGKWCGAGGSRGRVEATGYGCIYFLCHVLKAHDQCGDGDNSLAGREIAISGAGNVALHAALKAISLGAKVVTLSNSVGTIYSPEGLSTEVVNRAGEERLEDMAEAGFCFLKDKTPWALAKDIAMPCATQNEIDAADAEAMVGNGVGVVLEGANMPLTGAAEAVFGRNGNVIVVPSKAANAGGVAVSGLELTQNAIGQSWPLERVEGELKVIMKDIHDKCTAPVMRENGIYPYRQGADIAAFKTWAEALLLAGV